MQHGTCSDFNQYCPNARHNPSHHPRQHHQIVSLAAQSVGNLMRGGPSNNNNYSIDNDLCCYQSPPPPQHQSQQHLPRANCNYNDYDEQTPQKFRRRPPPPPNTTSSSHLQLNRSSRPRSHTLHAGSPKPTITTPNASAAYQPLLLSATTGTEDQLVHNHRSVNTRFQPNSNNINIYNNNNNKLRSCGCACCTNSGGVGPSALDYYQEHIYQFFYRRHQSNAIAMAHYNHNYPKAPGSASGRSTSTLTSPQTQQSPNVVVAATGSVLAGGSATATPGDNVGVSSNVDWFILYTNPNYNCTLLFIKLIINTGGGKQ